MIVLLKETAKGRKVMSSDMVERCSHPAGEWITGEVVELGSDVGGESSGSCL